MQISIKKHLKARSPRLLEIEQMKHFRKTGVAFDYFDFQEASDGFWYCWYSTENLTMEKAARELNENADD